MKYCCPSFLVLLFWLKTAFYYVLIADQDFWHMVRRWFSVRNELLGGIQMTSGFICRNQGSFTHVWASPADSWEPVHSWVPVIAGHVVSRLLQMVSPVEFLYFLEVFLFFINRASKLWTLVSCMLSPALSTNQLPILSKCLEVLHYTNVSLIFPVSEKLMSLCHCFNISGLCHFLCGPQTAFWLVSTFNLDSLSPTPQATFLGTI